MAKTKLMITGGAGYIGSATARRLLNEGYDVAVIDNLSGGFIQALPSEAEFIQLDIRDERFSDLLKKFKPAAVLHFAARLVVHESFAESKDYIDTNVTGSMKVIEACRQAGIEQFLFSSSCTVYGASLPTTTMGFAEDDRLAPISPYGATKAQVEKVLSEACSQGWLNCVSLRYFNVAGAIAEEGIGQRGINSTQLVKAAAETASGRREAMHVHGLDYATKDGSCVRDFIHIADLIDIHSLILKGLLRSQITGYEAFNCGYGRGWTVLEVLQTMQKVSGCFFPIIKAHPRPGDMPIAFANTSKLRRRLNWAPKHDDLDQLCRSAYEWEKGL